MLSHNLHNIWVVQHNCSKNQNVIILLLEFYSPTTDIVMIQDLNSIPYSNSRGIRTSISHGLFKKLIYSCNNLPQTTSVSCKSNPFIKCQQCLDFISDQDVQALEIETQRIEPIIILTIYQQIQDSLQQNERLPISLSDQDSYLQKTGMCTSIYSSREYGASSEMKPC